MANNQEQIEFSAALEDESVTTSEEEETNDSGDEDMIKFWKAQPTPGSIKQDIPIQEGPLKVQQVEDIPTQPTTLPPGLEWSTLDPTHPEEMNDIWTLLNGQYVEDDDAMFRFNYSKEMLRWYVYLPPLPSSPPSILPHTPKMNQKLGNPHQDPNQELGH